MRPLMLHGHERAITQIKYNKDGDLLFSVAKDTKPTVWYSVNGERLGTYNGHNGAVWCIDVNQSYTVIGVLKFSFTLSAEDSANVLTGSADNSIKLWDCETGRELNSIDTESAVRTCGFSSPRKIFYYSIDEQMRAKCSIFLNDVVSLDVISVVLVEQAKVTSASWGPFDNCLITGHENGVVSQYDLRNKECLKSIKPHQGQITDLQSSKDRTMLITSSKDTSAKLYDSSTLNMLKTYKTERPVNSAAISPLLDHVVLGGGQEAMEVTTTTTRAGKFDARFYHMIFEEEIGRVKGHFGPINSLAFHPDGKSYSSGGEDGYVRVHNFDQSYFDFKFEY